MNVTFYGQSCLAFKFAGKSLLFDPFIRPNELARYVDVSAVRTDGFFLTHGHLHHVADAVELAGRTGAPVTASTAPDARRRFLESEEELTSMPVGSSHDF